AGDGTSDGNAERNAPQNSPDRAVELPRFIPDGVFQKSTMVILSIPEPIVPEELTITDGCQVYNSAMYPSTGRIYGIQLYTPEARVRFRPGNPGVPFFAGSGTTITFDALNIRTLTVAECRVPEGERFSLRLPVADGWKIESVTTGDPTVLRDWSVLTRDPTQRSIDRTEENSTPGIDGSRELLVQFRRPIRPESPVLLQIAACGPDAGIGSRWRGDELLPFLFPSSEADTWVAVRPSPFCLWRSLETTPMPRTPWGRVRESVRKLFPQAVQSVQAWTDVADHLFVLDPPEVDYIVDQRVTASADAERLNEKIELNVLARSPGIDRLRIRYHRPRKTPPVWNLILATQTDTPENTVRVTTEPVSVVPIPEEPRGGMGRRESENGYTTWELRPDRPVENAFTFCEQRIRPLTEPLEVTCVSVAVASRQTGQLTIRKSPESGFRNHLFEAVPDRSGDPTFSFDPDLVVSSSRSAFEFLPPTLHTDSVAVRVWDSVLLSRMIDGTQVQNRIVWKIENEGVSRFPIRLPVGWDHRDVRELRIDDDVVTERTFVPADEPGNGGLLVVSIPDDRRYLTMVMTYTTRPVGSWLRKTLTPQTPQPEVPVLRRTQQLSLPPDSRLLSVRGGAFSTGRDPRCSAMERFFGVFARPVEEPRFSLLSLNWLNQRTWFPDTTGGSISASGFLRTLTDVADEIPGGSGSRGTDALRPERPESGSTGRRTWGELLRITGERLRENRPEMTILVDRIATGTAGIRTDTPVCFPENWSDMRSAPHDSDLRGMLLLENSGLTLLVCDRTVLVTTLKRTAFLKDSLYLPDAGHAWYVLPGPLSDRITGHGTGRDQEFVPLLTWRNLPPFSAGPWVGASSDASLVRIAGGTFFSAERMNDEPLTFVVCDRYQFIGFELFFLIASFCGVLCLPPLRDRLRRTKGWRWYVPDRWRSPAEPSALRPRVRAAILLTIPAIVIGLLLVVPDPFVGMFRGMFWGTTAGVLWISGRRRFRRPDVGGGRTGVGGGPDNGPEPVNGTDNGPVPEPGCAGIVGRELPEESMEPTVLARYGGNAGPGNGSEPVNEPENVGPGGVE
ncbi:MAG: hypothetical protein Q4C47_05260, partial [Planctomycetia bacterium]|nr:hypothetical protein [Planctomycetia bacterium]